MGILKTILMVVYIIVAVVLIILTLMQTKEDSDGAAVITGSNNFYNQNKGNTREGKLKKTTIALGVGFAVLAVALSIFYI